MSWEAVIGLEIHVQLATKSKLFSGAATAFGAEPNRQACAVDLGLPGVLPVINEEAVRMAIRFGLAVGGDIAPKSVFARKNYFYPDLPKGYQISQYELPIVRGGAIRIAGTDGKERSIRITRAHLEEDAGKSVHEGLGNRTGIDLNRAGTPLIEVVSEPDLRSAAEASAYMRKIHEVVVWLGICDGNMQEGSLRCDANVSLREPGTMALGTRAEIKNLNSFRFIEQAIEHEIARQTALLDAGKTVVQETRLYDPDRGETRPLRSKEDAQDYRYFPDPDLLPMEITPMEIESVRASMPATRDANQKRLVETYDLTRQDAEQLTANPATILYFDAAVMGTANPKLAAKTTANVVIRDLSAFLHREGIGISASPIGPDDLGRLADRIVDGTVSSNTASQVIQAVAAGDGDTDAVIEKHGLRQESDPDKLARYVDQVIAAHPEQARQFREGKDKVLGFLVGQVMKLSGGKANPQQVNALVREKLGR